MVLSVCVAALFWVFSDTLREYACVGYIGLFIACAAANASVFVPASSTVIIMSAAAALSPLWCGVIGGLGAAAGEQVSYWFGRSGKYAAEDMPAVKKLESRIEKSGFLMVFLFALIPNPAFDLAGAAAGLGRMSWTKYTLACVLGKVPKMIFFAFLGIFIITQMIGFLEANTIMPFADEISSYLRELLNSL